uniref:Uncharacterized protein n=1 Tax=Octopus bimaculoides TaxID=37653 RepID=A0A0L8FJU1_OCTBM
MLQSKESYNHNRVVCQEKLTEAQIYVRVCLQVGDFSIASSFWISGNHYKETFPLLIHT